MSGSTTDNQQIATPTQQDVSAQNFLTTSVPTNTQSSLQTSAEVAGLQQGDRSFSDRLYDIPTKFAPLTVAAAANAFINTGVEVANFFGADQQKVTIEDEFGKDSDITNYYNNNSGVVEGAGLLAGSLLPGMLGIKALKLVQAGKLGDTAANITGLMSSVSDKALASATVDAAENAAGSSLFGISKANLIKGVLAKAGDEALQGAVYQTATLATMHASPLTDNNTIKDDVNDVLDSAKGFGLFGGVIAGAGIYSKVAKGVRDLDLDSKSSEAFGLQGLSQLKSGDRIIKLYETLDNLPEQPTRFGQMKLNATKLQTNQSIQEEFIKLSGGDKEVASAFRDTVEAARGAGIFDSNELINQFASMSRAGRVNDNSLVSKSTDAYFIPKTVDSSNIAAVTHDDLLLKEQTGAAATSRAYTLRSATDLPTIARATDTITLPSLVKDQPGNTIRPYAGAMEAYRNGIDIFVDGNGGVHVNPDSTKLQVTAVPNTSRQLKSGELKAVAATGNLPAGSKPYEALNTTFDTQTGKIYNTPVIPVVGDLAKPKLTPAGLQVGDNFYPHTASKEFDPLTVDPTEANSRYVWAGKRGIKTGDDFSSTDLPMLEQLYREQVAGVDHSEWLSEFSDGVDVPHDPNELLDHIATVKQGMLGDMLSQGKTQGEIERVLNTPTKGITTGFNTGVASDIMTPWEASDKIRNIRLAYDISTTKDNEGNLLRGLNGVNYRMQVAGDINTAQVANYLSGHIGLNADQGQQVMSALKLGGTSLDADINGAGKSFLGNANANYGTLAQQAERVGRTKNQLAQVVTSKVNDTLASAIQVLRQNPAAAAEHSMFTFIRHSTGEDFQFLPDSLAAEHNLPQGTVVLKGSLGMDAKTQMPTWDRTYLPNGFSTGDTEGAGLKTWYSLSPEVQAVERASQQLNAARLAQRDGFWKAAGLNKNTPDGNILYAPPINPDRYPFFAYVRQREGSAFGESGASIVTARSSTELQQKIASLGPEYDVFTDKNLKGYFSAKGEYDFNRSFGTSKVDTELRRKGIYNNAAPGTRPEDVISDLVGWHQRQELHLLDDHISLHNAATFDQLEAMGKRFEVVSTSKKGFVDQLTRNNSFNPYMSYINTALNRNPKDIMPLWQFAQEKLEGFADTAFNTARSNLGAVANGILPAEDAAKMAQKFGLGDIYGKTLDEIKNNYYGGLVNQLPPENIIRKFVSTANTVLHGTVIRLDAFQQLIHGVTLPIMALLEHSSATDDLKALTSVNLPGSQQQVPAFTRTLYNAVKNFFGDDAAKLKQAYANNIGFDASNFVTHGKMLDALTLPKTPIGIDGWNNKMNDAIAAGGKLSGSNWMNSFIHFVAADVGRQTGEALGFTGQDLIDHTGTFAQRVLGNVAAGQRAGIFQGPVGSALGLFQSYQWNTMQQILRHLGDGDTKAIAMAAGLQSSIFGVSSLPGFQYLNNLIGERHGNETGSDLYTAANSLLGKDVGDYLMYGSFSGLLGTSFYSRGDLNVRRPTILPVNPLQWPSVQAGIRVYSTLSQLANNLASSGGNAPASILMAAEHNGLSRPLSGLAELVQGYSTNTQGQLISKNAGLAELSTIAGMSRLAGARPLDEAIALDASYRVAAIKARDAERLNELGTAVKTSLRDGDNEGMSEEQSSRLLNEYAQAGGNVVNFSKWMMAQSAGAQTSVVNKISDNMRNPQSQYMQQIMGGIPLPDFRNTGSTRVNPVMPEQIEEP